MKRLALAMHEAGEAQFGPAELAVLREETYELGSDGVSKTRLMKVRTLENLRFAFRSFALAHQLSASLKVDGLGWQSTQGSLQIRHSLHIQSPPRNSTCPTKRSRSSMPLANGCRMR